MVHILLMILKIIGILLLIILAIALVLVLAVLFVPLRYRLKADYHGTPRGYARVSWLLSLLTYRAEYGQSGLVQKVRICGICLWRSDKSREEADGGIMKLRQSLNGIWKFSYAPKPEQRKKDFYKPERSLGDFGEITVPGHIELQGYGKCQYINTMYPWEGHSEIKPPHVDWEDNPVGS